MEKQQSLPGTNTLIHSGNVYLPNLDTITSQLKNYTVMVMKV